MKNRNICRFIPANSEVGGINIINFVYETEEANYRNENILSTYRAAYVAGGEGKLFVYGKEKKLKSGDLFFMFPSVPYIIDETKDFELIYISFIGVRANMILDKLGINSGNCVFSGMEEIDALWRQAIEGDASDFRSEAVLLYAFSVLSDRREKNNADKNTDTVMRIKKYIDDNFNLPGLSLKTIGRELSYSEKYISSVFKKELKTGVSDYISTIRIQYACTLMDGGMTGISDISLLCGYTDPLYFSKVFKKKMGISPRAHINNIRSEIL